MRGRGVDGGAEKQCRAVTCDVCVCRCHALCLADYPGGGVWAVTGTVQRMSMPRRMVIYQLPGAVALAMTRTLVLPLI